jgi:hypothetical protein
LKKIVENGITTISTDFEAMGKIADEHSAAGTKGSSLEERWGNI